MFDIPKQIVIEEPLLRFIKSCEVEGCSCDGIRLFGGDDYKLIKKIDELNSIGEDGKGMFLLAQTQLKDLIQKLKSDSILTQHGKVRYPTDDERSLFVYLFLIGLNWVRDLVGELVEYLITIIKRKGSTHSKGPPGEVPIWFTAESSTPTYWNEPKEVFVWLRELNNAFSRAEGILKDKVS